MATLVLAGVASVAAESAAAYGIFYLSAGWPAASAAVGAKIGAVAGLAIDTFWTFPTLFKRPPVEGPRIDSLQLESATPGAPRYRLHGTGRIPGVRIWQQKPFTEFKDTSTGGGKGGSGGEFLTYKYYGSVAVEICEAITPISRVRKIYADGKLFYDEEADIVYSSTAIAASIETISVWPTGTKVRLILTNSDGSVDLSKFKSGKDLEVAGFTSPAVANNSNNSPTGAWRVLTSSKDPDDSNITTVKMEHPTDPDYAFVAKAAGDAVALFMKQPTHKTSQVKSVTFHLGGPDQMPDELIEAYETNVPAYRLRAYVVLEDLYLADFGSRIPNFEFLVEESVDPTVGDVISDELQRAGLPASAFDVSAIDATKVVHGYWIRGPQEPISTLGVLFLAFDIIARRPDDVYEFIDRDDAPTVTVGANDVSAHAPGDRVPRPMLVHDRAELSMPREFQVTFQNVFDEWQPDVAVAFNPHAESFEVETMDVALAMEPGEASAYAHKLLFGALSGRQSQAIQLPHTYLDQVFEGTVLDVQDELGDDWDIMVQRVDRADTGLVICEGRVEDPEILVQGEWADTDEDQEQSTTGGGDDPHVGPSVPSLQLISLPPLKDEHVGRVGLYAVATNEDQGLPWKGAVLYESTDGGTNFLPKAQLVEEGVLVELVTAPATTVDPEFVDYSNTIRVKVLNSSFVLSSVDEEAMLQGANRMWIGDENGGEVFGFATVAAVAGQSDQYDLSVLLRGLRGTEGKMAGHSSGDRGILLTAPGVHFVPLSPASVGTARHLKLVPQNGAPVVYESVPVTFDGGTARPMAPIHERVIHTDPTAGDIEVCWDFQTPTLTDEIEQERTDVGREGEMYEVEVYDNAVAADNLLRRIYVEEDYTDFGGNNSGPRGFNYSYSDRQADGPTGPNVIFRIYAVSRRVGRGGYLDVTAALVL